MHAMKSSVMFAQATSNMPLRAAIFALVLLAHVAAFSSWQTQPVADQQMQHDMAVSFALTTYTPPPILQQKRSSVAPAAVPVAEQAAVAAEPMPALAAAPQTAAAPVVADTQPDYKAAYLNNPPPVYPMVARRNGLQGRVLLNVEVLASGGSGKITVQSSSGYAMLDNAALQTVKSWRFVPARQGGQAVDKWFMIPIQFSLKDNQA